MIKQTVIFGLLSVVLMVSCNKKDEDKNTKPACEVNNFGILKVTFGDTASRHGIMVTKVGETMPNREKFTNAGVATDTLQLEPGAYHFNISSVDNSNLIIEDENYLNRSVSQCQELKIDVRF